MSDWAEGYWAAVKHFAVLSKPAVIDASPTPLDWMTAGASIGAAVGACLAAWLSWRAAAQSMRVTLEAERASLIQRSLDTYHESNGLMAKLEVMTPSRGGLFSNDMPDTKRVLSEELQGDWWSIQRLGHEAGEVMNSALKAEEIIEVAKLKRELLMIQSRIRDIIHMSENRLNIAWTNGLIEKPSPLRSDGRPY